MSDRLIHTGGGATIHVTPLGKDQAYITAAIEDRADARQATGDAYGKVAEVLADRGLQIVHERVFGSPDAHPAIVAMRADALGRRGIPADSPVTYIHGCPLWGEGLAGVNLLATRARESGDVWTVMDESGRPCGRGWRCHGATFLILQNLHGRNAHSTDDNSQVAQTGRMFDRADRILRSQQANYTHVTRTWVYLADILDWYDEFNEVRNAKYDGFGLMPQSGDGSSDKVLLPASTGIAGAAPTGAAATMDLLATIPDAGSPVEVRLLSNRKQRDAFKYGSAFSRGACICLPDATWISISGTAAIDERGNSLHPEDTRGQIRRTVENVRSLIAPEGAGLTDLCDTTVFLKRPEDAPIYREMAAELGLDKIPAVCVVADICRDELLFEVDAAAVVVRE